MILRQWIDDFFAAKGQEDASQQSTRADVVQPAQADGQVHQVPEPDSGFVLLCAFVLLCCLRWWKVRRRYAR